MDTVVIIAETIAVGDRDDLADARGVGVVALGADVADFAAVVDLAFGIEKAVWRGGESLSEEKGEEGMLGSGDFDSVLKRNMTPCDLKQYRFKNFHHAYICKKAEMISSG